MGGARVFVPIRDAHSVNGNMVPELGEGGGVGVLYVGVKVSCKTCVSPSMTVV